MVVVVVVKRPRSVWKEEERTHRDREIERERGCGTSEERVERRENVATGKDGVGMKE